MELPGEGREWADEWERVRIATPARTAGLNPPRGSNPFRGLWNFRPSRTWEPGLATGINLIPENNRVLSVAARNLGPGVEGWFEECHGINHRPAGPDFYMRDPV